MKRTEIEITSEGYVHASGYFRITADEPSTGNWKAELSRLVEETSQIRETYGKAMSDDGRLVGDERFRLIEELDDVMDHLIIIRSLIAEKTSFTITDSTINYHHQLNIRIQKKDWEADGTVGYFRKINFKKFGEWLKNLIEKLQVLIRSLAQAASDGVIDEVERNSLNKILDRMIFSVLIVRHQIERAEIE